MRSRNLDLILSDTYKESEDLQPFLGKTGRNYKAYSKESVRWAGARVIF